MDLSPMQQELLAKAATGGELTFWFSTKRMNGKRMATVVNVASAISLGHSVKIAGATPEQEEAIRQEALDLLARLDRG